MNSNSKLLGLIAGYGILPFDFLKNLNDGEVFVAGFKNYTPKKLSNYCKELRYFNIDDIQGIIRFFKQNNISKILLLGYIPHSIIFERKRIINPRTTKMLSKLQSNTAMSIFRGLLSEFEEEGIIIEPINKYIKSNFADIGIMTSTELSNSEKDNVEFGFEIAKSISKLDIGLSVVIKDKVVVAVEGLEGTDNCILRSKKLAGKDLIVIKVARPNQDMRFDIPVIGPRTVKVCKIANVKVLAVEAEKTYIIEKKEVINKMNFYGIKLYGIKKD